MLTPFVIGVGAAGNKAALYAVDNQVISQDCVMLINSTEKDIPKNYFGKKAILTSQFGGCGKEREVGKSTALADLQSGKLEFETMINPQTDVVIIVTSVEGGTGSGASPAIARYINEVMGYKVHIFALTGFETDPRGLRNTVGFFKDLTDSMGVSVIRNKKFLTECAGDFSKAEKAANVEFSIELSILLGNPIVDSEHNIDKADLEKVSTYPGYTDIEYLELTEKIKNMDMYNKYIQDMIDNSKSFDSEGTQKLLAVIINLPESEAQYIDRSQRVIHERYGQSYELFEHIQYDSSVENFIAFISAGNDIPIDEVEEVYRSYKEKTNSVKKSKSSFFDEVSEMEDSDDDFMFDGNSKKKTPNAAAKKDFFSSFGLETPNVPKSKSKNDLTEY